MKGFRRINLALIAVLGLVAAGCTRTVEGEQARWSRNVTKAGKFKAKYPSAASALDERERTAKTAFDAAAALSGEAQTQGMSAANYEFEKLLNAIEYYDNDVIEAERLKVQFQTTLPQVSFNLDQAILASKAMLSGAGGSSADATIGAFQAAREVLVPSLEFARNIKNNTMPTGVAIPTIPTVPGFTPAPMPTGSGVAPGVAPGVGSGVAPGVAPGVGSGVAPDAVPPAGPAPGGK